jgi:hypothetical protein
MAHMQFSRRIRKHLQKIILRLIFHQDSLIGFFFAPIDLPTLLNLFEIVFAHFKYFLMKKDSISPAILLRQAAFALGFEGIGPAKLKRENV